jgi:hypothetical protein
MSARPSPPRGAEIAREIVLEIDVRSENGASSSRAGPYNRSPRREPERLREALRPAASLTRAQVFPVLLARIEGSATRSRAPTLVTWPSTRISIVVVLPARAPRPPRSRPSNRADQARSPSIRRNRAADDRRADRRLALFSARTITATIMRRTPSRRAQAASP